jgi:hypothetical protein
MALRAWQTGWQASFVIAGSIWIMTNLDDNMVPPPELMNLHMQH